MTSKRISIQAFTALLLSFSLSANAPAQPPRTPRTPPVTGSLTGYVGYSDAKSPARLAQIILIKVFPSELLPGNESAETRPSGAGALATFTQTGLDGHFVMSQVPVGKYIVAVQQNGTLNPIASVGLDALNKIKSNHVTEDQIKDYLADLTLVTIEQGKTANVTVTLSHGASIFGTLSYTDGSPAVGAQVHLLAKSGSGSFVEPELTTLGSVFVSTTLAGAATDDAGHFHIAGLPPGTYAIRATLPLGLLKNLSSSLKGIIALGMSSPDNVSSATQYDSGLSVYSGNVLFRKDLKPIDLSAGQSYSRADITIPLTGMFTVQAKVKDAATGKPLDVAQVQLMDAEGKETLRAQFVDDDGNCTFDYVPAGQYTLAVVNAMDLSGVGKVLSPNYDPKKAVRYDATSTKVLVNGNVAGIVLQVSKPNPPQPAP